MVISPVDKTHIIENNQVTHSIVRIQGPGGIGDWRKLKLFLREEIS